jgi:ubiquinone/menaquinone biosynthesis C-methylase UbiE
VHQSTGYDSVADIYDICVEASPAAKRNLPFYLEEYLHTVGPVVELGVGNGRIAIEAARQGKPIIGVDCSAEMLRLCQERAEAADVAHLLILVHADIRDFTLPEPAQLISMPSYAIGHLVTLEDKQSGLRHIYSQLSPGGQLIFDHFVFSPENVQRYRAARLQGKYSDAATGHDVLVWMASHYESETQMIRMIFWTDELDGDGVLLRRKYRCLSFSWLEPDQARVLLEECGFTIETVYGDFDRRPFTADSTEQIWVARRPGNVPP